MPWARIAVELVFKILPHKIEIQRRFFLNGDFSAAKIVCRRSSCDAEHPERSAYHGRETSLKGNKRTMKTMHLLIMTGAALMLAPLAVAQNQPSSIWNGGSVTTDLSAPKAVGMHVLRVNDSDETARYSNSDTRTGRTLGTRGTIPGVTNGLKTVLRVYDTGTVSQTTSLSRDQGLAGAGAPSDVICNLASLAEHGEIAPNTDGGTLDPVAFANPTTVNSSGRIAFNSEVDGSPRNQGVFIGNSDGTLDAIAIGCGGLGGSGDTTSLCGDPSPIGGNFSGFFFGTGFTPDINDAGDVLFFSDVNGGSSRRGLFLYRAASQDITKVAVIGDTSPIGGTFGAVGPGSLNNNGEIVFLASPVGTIDSNFFMWNNGVVTKVAAIGDPAPGGSAFFFLGTESLGFADGTNIPFGPVPDINDSEQISFRAIVSGGITDRGISFVQGVSINGTSKFPTRLRQAGLILICRRLQLTMPARSPSSLISPTPDTLIPVGSQERRKLAESDRFLRSGRWWAMPRPCLLTQSHADNR